MGDRLDRLAQAGRPFPLIRQRVVRANAPHHSLAGKHLADDVDVFAGACERFAERLAVPSLHDLWARDAEAENRSAAAEMVQCQRVHGATGRRTSRELHDRRTEAYPLGLRTPPRQRREGIRAPRLGREHGVEAGFLGGANELAGVRGWLRAPVPQLQSELHDLAFRTTLASRIRTCSTR